jgi:hypothetical protein
MICARSAPSSAPTGARRPHDRRALLAGAGDRAPGGGLGGGAGAGADGGEAGWLAVWRRSSKPVRDALLAWPGAFDPEGAPASVSLLVLPRELRVIFDDDAVQQARRRVLAGGPWAAVTSLVRDPSTFGGSLVAARGGDAPARVLDDPFAAIAPGLVRRLDLGAGLVGAPAAPAGPVIERYGAAQPWPGDRFDETGQSSG